MAHVEVLAQSSTLMQEAGYSSTYLRSQFWGGRNRRLLGAF